MAHLLPLESNPDVMNKFLHLMGVPDKWKVVDVYGLDADALNWVPKPVLALILLCPCSEEFYRHAESQSSEIKKNGQKVDPDLFYMRQYVSNACGTVALIHSVANKVDILKLSDGPFKNLLQKALKLTPEERGNMLKPDYSDSEIADAFKLFNAHQELAREGQTDAKGTVNHHFIAFVEKGGNLYELDGRKEFPINHGPTTEDTFLEDAAKICREFIERDSNDVNFTIMALSAAE